MQAGSIEFDIEREFAACVSAIGGVLLDGMEFPKGVRKADYWFPAHNTVAEFKRLSEDLPSTPAFRKRVGEMWRKWLRSGLVRPDPRGRHVLNLQRIPKQCSDEFLAYVERRFESNLVTPANQQIKQTRIHLKAPNARGLLIVANDGDTLSSPEMFARLIARTTRSKHSGINSIIFFSANLPANVRGEAGEVRYYWVDGLLNRAPAPNQLRTSLQRAWYARLEALLGHSLPDRRPRGAEGADAMGRLYHTPET